MQTVSTRLMLTGSPPLQLQGGGLRRAGPATSNHYARVMALPLLEGRTWQPGDRASSWAVALVNREAVRRYWPAQSPIGERIAMLDAKGQADGPAIEIVGVVDKVIGSELTEPPPPRIYRPLGARPLASVAFLVRVSGDPAALGPAVRDVPRAENRDLAVSDVGTARRQIRRPTRQCWAS